MEYNIIQGLKTFNQAIKLLPKFTEVYGILYGDFVSYYDLLISIMPISFVYNHFKYDEIVLEEYFQIWFPKEMQNDNEFKKFSTKVKKYHGILEDYYGKDVKWTIIAYVWKHEWDKDPLYIIEEQCKYNYDCIELGRHIKRLLTKEDYLEDDEE